MGAIGGVRRAPFCEDPVICIPESCATCATIKDNLQNPNRTVHRRQNDEGLRNAFDSTAKTQMT